MILVTGATGLTGQFVTAELLRRGRAVRALCRRPPTAATGAEVVLGDLRDPASLERAARGATGIVHAACTYEDSALDVAAMCALLAGWGTGPFIFVSSLDVYGLAAGPAPITEETPVTESYNDYSRGKVICERLLAEAAAARGRDDVVMLRAPYIWGPHATARRRLLPERLLAGQPLVLPGRDEAEWRRYQDVWVDVRDLATIIAECVARPGGGPFNVLSGHFIWHDLYQELIRLCDSRIELVHRNLDEIGGDELARKELYAQTWRFSEAKLARFLGTIPRHSFADTIRDTVLSSA